MAYANSVLTLRFTQTKYIIRFNSYTSIKHVNRLKKSDCEKRLLFSNIDDVRIIIKIPLKINEQSN